jgi:mRNA interferase MazF
MSDLRTGDIVTIDFPGAQGIKRRPPIVVSSSVYHQNRPDVIVGVVTSQIQHAVTPTDHRLLDWQEAGLHRESAFRTFLATLPATAARWIGHCSDRDWQGIQACLERAIGD